MPRHQTVPKPPAPRWSRAREARGSTLIELLVATSMFAVVLVAVFSIYDSASHAAFNDAERGTALTEETSGVARMVQELQQAYQVNAPRGAGSANYMDVMVRIPGKGDQRLFFDCTYVDPTSGYRDCVRYQTAASQSFTAGVVPAATSPAIVVARVLNNTSADPSDPVFTNISTPSGSGGQASFLDVSLKTPSKGSQTGTSYTHSVVLGGAVWLRELDFGR